MENNIVEVKNLRKEFGDFVAVKDVSFTLADGEILGLLGVNGAGKTTTLQMLLGVLTPTSGSIHYFGKNLQTHRGEILERVNFSSTYTNLPWGLTVMENFQFISYLYDIKDRKDRIRKVISRFRLEELQKKKMSALSAGQRTRVNLAKSFINHPKVLLLDEPTASMDPEVAKYIRDFLLEQRKEFQVSIIITSHNMNEVEEICDRIVFMNEGRIIADDTPEALAKTIEVSHVELLIKEGLKKLESYCGKMKLNYHREGNFFIVDVKESAIAKFLQDITEQGIVYNEISIEKPTLEDYFLQVAKGGEL